MFLHSESTMDHFIPMTGKDTLVLMMQGASEERSIRYGGFPIIMGFPTTDSPDEPFSWFVHTQGGVGKGEVGWVSYQPLTSDVNTILLYPECQPFRPSHNLLILGLGSVLYNILSLWRITDMWWWPQSADLLNRAAYFSVLYTCM